IPAALLFLRQEDDLKMRAPVSRPHRFSVLGAASRRLACGRRLDLLGELALALAILLGPDRMTRGPAAPAVLRLEFEPAQLAASERGPLKGVVLFAGEQMPEKHTELSGRRDERDLGTTAGAHALIEGAERTRGSDEHPGCLAEHVARLRRALLWDATVPRWRL